MIVILIGCFSQRSIVVEPIKKPLTSYKILEVPTLTSYLQSGYNVDVLTGIQNRLVEDMIEYNRKHPGNPIFANVTKTTDKTEEVLMMKGTLVSYESGSRAKRYFLSFGAGKAYCTVMMEFVDKATGESLGKVNFEGEISSGCFGGGKGGTEKGLVKAIMKYFEKGF